MKLANENKQNIFPTDTQTYMIKQKRNRSIYAS